LRTLPEVRLKGHLLSAEHALWHWTEFKEVPLCFQCEYPATREDDLDYVHCEYCMRALYESDVRWVGEAA
jgi:hypothetical protein